ncbi:uncharacterized protein LOC112005249 [Quercus suber]|uniref:uncharacterized protein LOC112005249 n=1 Tax=Quercus suber TaxID=58331 RepID=UPI000CE17983|nr:uncharacterized protein LOC112005249 [Quercus suber]
MNIIIWNSRGSLKPNFQKYVTELAHNYNPTIMVVMETKIGGDRAKAITNRLPFDRAIHSNTIGYAGGLWLLWNSDRVEVSLISKTEQEIHVTVKSALAELHNMAWIIAGDFNEPLVEDDKFGGRTVSMNRSLQFKDCLDKCNMVDLGFSGPRFTWSNGRELSALIQERIDRFFVNTAWYSNFPEAKVTHLTRCHSDHCPVLLETTKHYQLQLPRPFRFQSCWLSDPSFPVVVSSAWNSVNSLQGATNNLVTEVKRWNKEHFGNFFSKKRRIMARLNGIQKAIALRPSSNLLDLEKQLQRELEIILDQERDIWALKSRVNWMIQGDRNTSFYYMSTMVRRSRNRISAIKNSVGEWLYDERDVMEHIRGGFEDLFCSSLALSERNPQLLPQG